MSINKQINKKDTKQQLLLAKWIRGLGVGCNLEEDFEPYVVDIYIPDLDLAVEVDGPFHFKKRDKVRDEVLNMKYGITVWRFKSQDINQSFKPFFEDQLMSFIKETIDAHTQKPIELQW